MCQVLKCYDWLFSTKKYKKCYKKNIKLIILTEEKANKESLLSWSSSHTKINGRFLVEMINEVKLSYGVEFYFCDKNKTGECLIKLLKRNK